MFHKSHRGVYTSDLLSSIEGLQHGFTTRVHGDMRDTKNITSLLGHDVVVVQAQQVHGSAIKTISSNVDKDNVFDNVDGLISADGENKFVLVVRTADCVPILTVDPDHHIVGVAHSGWKGTVARIANGLIGAMVKAGATVTKIRVVLGPSIGACCYNVHNDRMKLFAAAFGRNAKGLTEKNGEFFLDLEATIVEQLIQSGVKKAHIEMAQMCTASLHPEFFSYRKDSKATFGEMIGYIGYKRFV